MTTHGLTAHALYNTWYMMRRRCLDPLDPEYDHYGGSNVRIHAPWIDDLRSFVGWIAVNLGERPDGCTLDRINPHGSYVPGNLRWATAAGQARNRRPGAKHAKGAYLLPSGRYEARIMVDRRNIGLGTFDTEREAADAYDMAAVRYHGDFACTNRGQ